MLSANPPSPVKRRRKNFLNRSEEKRKLFPFLVRRRWELKTTDDFQNTRQIL